MKVSVNTKDYKIRVRFTHRVYFYVFIKSKFYCKYTLGAENKIVLKQINIKLYHSLQ